MYVDLKFAVEFFRKNNNYTVICHVNPDGDTLGSGYALCGALHAIGKRARLICDDTPSPRFEFLKEALSENPDLNNFPANLDSADEVFVAVDVADIQLLGCHGEKSIDFCIDHHVSNGDYAKYTLLDTTAAACAELVWELIMEIEDSLGMEEPPLATPAIAAAIYTGISTDTGCFKYSNTSTITHVFAAEVMGYGFDVARINYIMFEMKTRERVMLEQQALSSMEYYFSGKCALTVLTAKMLENIDPEDSGNISALPKQIEGVIAGVVIKEKEPGVFKMSIRTSDGVDAQKVCVVLGGGGHLRAAGCTLKGDITTVKKMILDEIGKQLTEV
jgi:phosphoesterase RecJ-like protein